MQTNILDRFNAWRADPETPEDVTLQDAFVEGFAQCMELVSGDLRERKTDESTG